MPGRGGAGPAGPGLPETVTALAAAAAAVGRWGLGGAGPWLSAQLELAVAGAKRRIRRGERAPGRAESAAAAGAPGALASAASPRSKCLRLRFGGGGRGGGNRGRRRRWRRWRRGSSWGRKPGGCGRVTDPTHPRALQAGTPGRRGSPGSAEGQAGAGSARGLGAPGGTRIRRRPLGRDWQGRGAPPPPSNDTPQSQGGAGCRGFPSLCEGRPPRGGCTSVCAPPSLPPPRWPLWLFGAAEMELVLPPGIPEFLLSVSRNRRPEL